MPNNNTDRVSELEARHDECVVKARECLDRITDDVDAARAEEINTEANGYFDEADRIRSQLETARRAADHEGDLEAREEARRRAAPSRSDATRVHEPTENDERISPEILRARDVLNVRWANGENLSEAEMVERHRLTSNEKRFWQAIQTPNNRAQDFDDLRVSEEYTREQANAIVQARDFPVDAAAAPNLTVGTDASAGYLAPTSFSADVVRAMKAFGPLNDGAHVRVLSTADGRKITYPTFDDTGNVGVRVNENTAPGFANVTVGQLSIDAYKYSTKAFPVSREILQDSIVAIEPLLRDAMAERLGRKLNTDYTEADGNNDPQGIITGVEAQATQKVTVATDNTLTADDILNLIHKVDPAYRNGRARFMFHDSTLLALRKLKDDADQYIWQPDIRVGAPGRIFGYPYFVNQDTPALSEANKTCMVFGDFTNFIVRRVRNLVIRRLDELPALVDQVIFVGFMRTDSRLIDHRGLVNLNTDAP